MLPLASAALPLAPPGGVLAFDGAAEAEATMVEATPGEPLTGVAADAGAAAAAADADPAGEEVAPIGDGAPAPPDLALLKSTTLTTVPSFCKRC